jgi:hypothetical protein
MEDDILEPSRMTSKRNMSRGRVRWPCGVRSLVWVSREVEGTVSRREQYPRASGGVAAHGHRGARLAAAEGSDIHTTQNLNLNE